MEPLPKIIANKLKQNSKSIDNAQKISDWQRESLVTPVNVKKL